MARRTTMARRAPDDNGAAVLDDASSGYSSMPELQSVTDSSEEEEEEEEEEAEDADAIFEPDKEVRIPPRIPPCIPPRIPPVTGLVTRLTYALHPTPASALQGLRYIHINEGPINTTFNAEKGWLEMHAMLASRVDVIGNKVIIPKNFFETNLLPENHRDILA